MTKTYTFDEVNEWFTDEISKYETIYSQIFDVLSSPLGIVEERIVEEGNSALNNEPCDGYVTQETPTTLGLGLEIDPTSTEEEVEKKVRSLAFSMLTTTEIVHADVLLNGFSPDHLFGDGQPLFSDAHPVFGGLTQSNILPASDLTMEAVEDMCKAIYTTKNSRGLPIVLSPHRLVVPSTLKNAADLIMPGGVIVNPYLKDSKAWYITTTVEVNKGLISLLMRELNLQSDGESKFKAVTKFVASCANWRSIFANPGL